MKLVIFDFDSTIVELDIPWDQVKEEALELAKGHDIEVDGNLHMMDVSNTLLEYPDIKEPLNMAFLRHESRCVQSRAYTVFPGMRELIKDLKAKGYQLAVASANCVPTIEEVLRQIGILDSFDLVLGRESVERNKPSPDQLLQILEVLDGSREDVLYIGDSRYDEGAAKAAGVKFFNIQGHGPKVDELRKMLL